MEKCALCQTKEADKKGSHIVPLFLIQTMVNEEGKKGRDKQISIELGALSTGLYFGRSVSMEKVNQVLGREMTDEEIENQSDPFVLDNFFCSDCETRLSNIESHYSTLTSSITKYKDDLYVSKCQSKYSTLFWTSVIWRISASKIAGYNLGHEEEKLRVILDETLTLKAGDLESKISESKILDSVGYCIVYCPDQNDPTSRLFMAVPHLNNPSCIFINQYVLIFNSRGQFRSARSNSFFGFDNYNKEEAFNPLKNENEIVQVISSDDFLPLIRDIFKFKADVFQEKIQQLCHDIFLTLFKMPMPPTILGSVMHRIIHEDQSLPKANRYKIERMSTIIGEEIIKAKNS